MSVEKRQQAISDCETEITELEAREVSTPEEVEARNTELSAAADKLEAAVKDLKEFRRVEAIKASAEEVRSDLTDSGAVQVQKQEKTEVRAVSAWEPKPLKCFRSRDAAIAIGKYVQAMAGIESRAASAYPMGSVGDVIKDSAGGETPTYDGRGGKDLVIAEMQNSILEQLYYTSVCLELASTYTVNTNSLILPIAGDLGLSSWYLENTEIAPSLPPTSHAVLDLKKMASRQQLSNELLADSPIAVANVVVNQVVSSFARTADDAYLNGADEAGIDGIVGAIEGYNTGSNVLEVADADAPTTSELAFAWKTVHQNATDRKWLVSPAGWSAVMAIATAPEAGAVVTDAVRAQIFGAPVLVSSQLPEDILAIYGDFSMASSCGTKANGVQIRTSADRAIEFDQTVVISTNRMAFAPHSPEFLAMIKAPAGGGD